MVYSISIDHYMNDQNNNIVVSIGDLDLYFSYKTIIAYRHGTKLRVTDKKYSVTTSKHQNAIDPTKSHRVNAADFEMELNELLKILNLKV